MLISPIIDSTLRSQTTTCHEILAFPRSQGGAWGVSYQLFQVSTFYVQQKDVCIKQILRRPLKQGGPTTGVYAQSAR